MHRRTFFLSLAALCLALPAALHADDWPQFRKDPSRSGASNDKLKFPLEEVWSWSTRGLADHSPLYYSTALKDRVYFTASEGSKRFIVCADIHSGKLHWRRALHTENLRFPISDIAGPAVSESGTVFVYDWLSPSKLAELLADPVNQGTTCPTMGANFAVRTFDAQTGKEGRFFPLSLMGANGILPRLVLLEGRSGQAVTQVPRGFAGCPP